MVRSQKVPAGKHRKTERVIPVSKWEPKEKRVQDIIEAAIRVFLEKGYEGASMEAIAREAGISKGGLYHHFSSKDEILYYANEKLCEPIALFMQEALEAPDAVTGLKKYIRNYLEHWIAHQNELTFFFLTMTKSLASPDTWNAYEEYYNTINDFLSALFAKGIQAGQLKEHMIGDSTVPLLSALDGVLVYLIMNKNMDLEETIKHFENQFIVSQLTVTP